jgi:hypothetical protein
MASGIPSLLYRGDDDRKQVRDLKQTLHHSQLQTNLLKGGKGHVIFESPLVELVANHVNPGWAASHFLSFSEDKQTAFRFGLHCELEEVDQMLENYVEYYEQEQHWNFALITISTEGINWSPIANGIYHGAYEPGLVKFKNYPGIHKVILINVGEAITSYKDIPGFTTVQANALRDKEWLLLPATEIILNTGKTEYSGILDGNCITAISRYKKLT